MDETPRYSTVGLSNRDIFLAEKADLLVYFEDENWEEFYLSLLETVGISVDEISIFCLGGKSKLKQKLSESPEQGKKRLFVFDKDFDDLVNKVITSPEAAYLGRYSIENYFFSLPLFERFVVSQKKGVRKVEVQLLVDTTAVDDFLSWYRQCCTYFIVAQKFRLRIESTKVEFADIAVTPSGARREDWWADYLSRFNERVAIEAAHLLVGRRLQSELDNAFVARNADIADGDENCHLPGKHLLSFCVERVRTLLSKKDEEDVYYKFMMNSLPFIPKPILDEIAERLNAVISIKGDEIKGDGGN